MNEDIRELSEEIRSIVFQYRQEIEGKYKPWPSSIKKRVLGLSRKGLPQQELVELTGITYGTNLKWRKKAGEPLRSDVRRKKFHELAVKTTAAVPVPAVVPKEQLAKRSACPEAISQNF